MSSPGLFPRPSSPPSDAAHDEDDLPGLDALWEPALNAPPDRTRAPAPPAASGGGGRGRKRRRLLECAASERSSSASEDGGEWERRRGCSPAPRWVGEQGPAGASSALECNTQLERSVVTGETCGSSSSEELAVDFSPSLSPGPPAASVSATAHLSPVVDLDALSVAATAGRGEPDAEGDADAEDHAEDDDDGDEWDFGLPGSQAADGRAQSPPSQGPFLTAEPSSADRRAAATSYIESQLLLTLRQLSHLVQHETGDEPAGVAGRVAVLVPPEGEGKGAQGLRWPKRRGKGGNSLHLARVWRVLALVRAGLRSEARSTKRDVFYKDPALFGAQRNVDGIIDKLVAASGLRRGDFNVVASPKGLWASNIVDVQLDGGEGLLSSRGKATLIPPGESVVDIVPSYQGGDLAEDDNEGALRFILIVEKEATFQTLCAARWGVAHGVMLTGKGFPDLATRQFAARLARQYPLTPVYALVDGDPDGLEILSCYQFGSRAQAGNAGEMEMHVESLQWLGVKPSEWGRLNIDWDLMLPLTERDHRKIRSMLARPAQRLPQEWKKELCHMQHLRRKAEIQLLQSSPPSHSAASALFVDASHVGPASAGVERLIAYLNARIGLEDHAARMSVMSEEDRLALDDFLV